MSDQEQAAQDPVQQSEDPDGTRLVVLRAGQRVSVLIGRLKIDGQNPVALVFPRLDVMVGCECGRPDCWGPPPASVKREFTELMRKSFINRGHYVEGADLHQAFVGLMKSVMVAFAHGGLN